MQPQPQTYCNESYKLENTARNTVYNSLLNFRLPSLFNGTIFCAKHPNDDTNVCQGDSGGPVITKDVRNQKFIQIGVTHGSLIECSAREFPGIFVRLDHPKIWKFLNNIINLNTLGVSEGNNKNET